MLVLASCAPDTVPAMKAALGLHAALWCLWCLAHHAGALEHTSETCLQKVPCTSDSSEETSALQTSLRDVGAHSQSAVASVQTDQNQTGQWFSLKRMKFKAAQRKARQARFDRAKRLRSRVPGKAKKAVGKFVKAVKGLGNRLKNYRKSKSAPVRVSDPVVEGAPQQQEPPETAPTETAPTETAPTEVSMVEESEEVSALQGRVAISDHANEKKKSKWVFKRMRAKGKAALKRARAKALRARKAWGGGKAKKVVGKFVKAVKSKSKSAPVTVSDPVEEGAPQQQEATETAPMETAPTEVSMVEESALQGRVAISDHSHEKKKSKWVFKRMRAKGKAALKRARAKALRARKAWGGGKAKKVVGKFVKAVKSKSKSAPVTVSGPVEEGAPQQQEAPETAPTETAPTEVSMVEESALQGRVAISDHSNEKKKSKWVFKRMRAKGKAALKRARAKALRGRKGAGGKAKKAVGKFVKAVKGLGHRLKNYRKSKSAPVRVSDPVVEGAPQQQEATETAPTETAPTEAEESEEVSALQGRVIVSDHSDEEHTSGWFYKRIREKTRAAVKRGRKKAKNMKSRVGRLLKAMKNLKRRKAAPVTPATIPTIQETEPDEEIQQAAPIAELSALQDHAVADSRFDQVGESQWFFKRRYPHARRTRKNVVRSGKSKKPFGRLFKSFKGFKPFKRRKAPSRARPIARPVTRSVEEDADTEGSGEVELTSEMPEDLEVEPKAKKMKPKKAKEMKEQKSMKPRSQAAFGKPLCANHWTAAFKKFQTSIRGKEARVMTQVPTCEPGNFAFSFTSLGSELRRLMIGPSPDDLSWGSKYSLSCAGNS